MTTETTGVTGPVSVSVGEWTWTDPGEASNKYPTLWVFGRKCVSGEVVLEHELAGLARDLKMLADAVKKSSRPRPPRLALVVPGAGK